MSPHGNIHVLTNHQRLGYGGHKVVGLLERGRPFQLALGGGARCQGGCQAAVITAKTTPLRRIIRKGYRGIGRNLVAIHPAVAHKVVGIEP